MNLPSETPVAIVGAGPSGLSAASVLSHYGMPCVVLDDQLRPGGQYLKQPPGHIQTTEKEHSLLNVCGHETVTYLPETTVWHWPSPNTLAYAMASDNGRLKAESIILAAGAYDTPIPFPGWALPGVISAGGVLNLYKGQRVVPGSRVVVAGNGPLLMVVADTLIRSGVKVLGLVDSSAFRRHLVKQFSGLLGNVRLLGKGLGHGMRLMTNSVPVMQRHVVTRATGGSRVSTIKVNPLLDSDQVDWNNSSEIEVDALVTGFGLTPSVELLRLAGCTLEYRVAENYWAPQRTVHMETSIDAVYATGDGAEISGYINAALEGRIAALDILNKKESSVVLKKALERALIQRRKLQKFSTNLASCYRTGFNYTGLITPDTLICRCENVAYSDILCLLEVGSAKPSLARIKSETRCGMGRCGGRNCLPSLTRVLGQSSIGESAQNFPPELPRARPPARLVSLGALLSEKLPEPDIPSDPHLPRAQKNG